MATAAVRSLWHTGDSEAEALESWDAGASLEIPFWPGPAFHHTSVTIWSWSPKLETGFALRAEIEEELDLVPGQPYWYWKVMDPHGHKWTTEPAEHRPIICVPHGAQWNAEVSDPMGDLWWAKFIMEHQRGFSL